MTIFDDWTRVQWWLLHTYASHFPNKATEQRRKSFVTFMEKMAENFPCGSCGAHFLMYMKENPLFPATETTESLKKYFYNFHETVNKKRGKPTMHTFEEVNAAFKPGFFTKY